jgi:hypothetical protein
MRADYEIAGTGGSLAVSNETDQPRDLLALNRVIATAIAIWTYPRHLRIIWATKSILFDQAGVQRCPQPTT